MAYNAKMAVEERQRIRREKLLKLLRPDRYVATPEIISVLVVHRLTIRTDIAALKAEGHKIESMKGKGRNRKGDAGYRIVLPAEDFV